ncbi:unnamed protein product [Rotaria magnacalcarata]|uniref:Uncharacterized protein n=1 Tax=Rotaria magnacalcarata TaxID=392030 RepID=A0A816FA91_9BILA|nr:unnamed protein product [Rotaria magnacalcarata]
MPTNELKSLQSNLDCQIAANGLLSTSKYGSIARVFIVEVTNTSEFKVVIFQITVDASNLKNVVFVDINQYIGKADENESEKKILFNIKGVNYESESDIWIIKMEVTDENVSELKKQEIKRMKLSSDHPEIGTTFNNIALTCKLGQYNRAITQLNLSSIYLIQKDYYKALSLCIKACNGLRHVQPVPDAEIINCQVTIENIYLDQQESIISEGY